MHKILCDLCKKELNPEWDTYVELTVFQNKPHGLRPGIEKLPYKHLCDDCFKKTFHQDGEIANGN